MELNDNNFVRGISRATILRINNLVRAKPRHLKGQLVIPHSIIEKPFDPATGKPLGTTQPVNAPSGNHGPDVLHDPMQFMKGVDQLIRQGGDPLIGDVSNDTRFSKFVTNPITRSTLILIDHGPIPSGISRLDMALHFFTLAFKESTYDPGAVNGNATGALQLMRGTYAAMLKKGQDLLVKAPAFVMTRIRGWFTESRKKGKQWMTGAHAAPASDQSQGITNFAQLVDLVELVNKRWTFTSRGWTYNEPASSTVNAFTGRYANLLRDQGQGRQVLITTYHTMGASIFNKVPEKWTYGFNPPDRMATDATIYRKLAVLPGLRQLIDLATGASVTKGTGDVIDDVEIPSPVRFASVLDFNAYLGQLLKIPYLLESRGTAIKTSAFQHYRKYTKRAHLGIDLRARTVGLPVFAPDNATVQYVRLNLGSGWGKYLVLKNDDGSGFRFAHLSRVLAPVGSRVFKGQIIGLSGKTDTKQPHLHLEYWDRLQTPNPLGNQTDPESDPLSRWKYAVNSK